MKTLLYFEEYISDLSKKIYERKDFNLVILRAKKTIGKYIPIEALSNTRIPTFIIDTDAEISDEITRFKDWLNNKNIKLDYFLNDSEYYLDYSNRIAKGIGLESLSDEQIEWVRDKVAMKKRFNEIGLKTVNYRLVESRKDIIDFYNKNDNKPIVFKPTNMMNSIDVYIINSISDIDNLAVDLSNNRYMVESYCEDQEWSIESLVQNGKVLDSYVTYIPNRTLWAAINGNINCHMTVPKLPNYFNFNPKDFIQKIVDGMNLKNGAMTIEVFVDKEGNVMPSELGWRLPGCQATKNHNLSYGIDMYNSLIDIAIDKQVELKYKPVITSVGDLYLPNKEGLVTNITSMEDLLKMDGVIDGELFARVGSIQTKRRVGNDSSGWVQIEGKDEYDTYKKMKQVFDSFVIETVDNDKKGIKKYVKKS